MIMHTTGRTLCRKVSDKEISKRCHYSRFMIGPIEYGQAISYGTSIRRTLLGLRGPHISVITIRDLTHEFNTILGLKESANEILANLSKIVIFDSGTHNILTGKNDHFSNTYQTVNFQFKGPGILTAKAINLASPFAIVDGNQYIATVDTAITLDIIISIKNDRYNNIPLASAFPFSTFLLKNNNQVVSNVNLNVISLDGLNEECLILEVWTNGGITPDRAVRLSGSIACSFYKTFLTIDNSNSGGRIRTSE